MCEHKNKKKNKHSFTFWNWQQEAKRVFFLSDSEGIYFPDYTLWEKKQFKHKKFGIFPMKKYKITIEEVEQKNQLTRVGK